MNGEKKKRVAVSLSKENVEWIDANYNNRSAFIDDLITQRRNGKGQIDDAVREFRIEQLRSEISSKETEVKSKRRELEHLTELEEKSEKRESKYKDRVSEVGENFANSAQVFPTFRSDANDIATEFGKTLPDVSNDIREYVEERYDIEDDRWTDAYGDGML